MLEYCILHNGKNQPFLSILMGLVGAANRVKGIINIHLVCENWER